MHTNIPSDMYPRKDCWICGSKDSLHQHHIIPSAYGGKNGPLCTLCSTCHGAVHTAAKRQSAQTLEEIGGYCTSWLKDIIRKNRALYLAQLIYKARDVSNGDQNKTVKISVTLTGEKAQKLQLLQQQLGLTKQQAIVQCIDSLYQRLFSA